jgi:RNA polymerase sigma-70 factor (ECF subfamily)
VARCLNGDEDAFAELFRRHEGRALRLAYALLGDRAAAEDAKQEGFLTAFQTLPRMHDGVAFSSWLHQNVVWAVRTQLRRAHHRHEVSGPAGAVMAGHDEFERQERSSVAVAALRSLPAGAREALALRFYLDLPEAEIARLLGCRPGTVKSRISRALRQLKESVNVR